MKKGYSLMFLAGVFLFVLVLLFTGYKFWQKSVLQKDLVGLELDIKTTEKSLDSLEKENIRGLITAKRVVNRLSTEEIKWSNVLKEVKRTLPSNLDIDILSYSGTGGNEISMNAITLVSKTVNPYSKIAEFIKAFDSSLHFFDGFVPSIASGINPEGQEILSFSFSAKFEETPREFEFPEAKEEPIPVAR